MNTKIKTQLHKIDQKLGLLLHDLQHYSDAKLNQQPDESSWSVLQVMQHLMIVEGYAHRYLQKKLSYNPDLQKAGLLANFRSALLNFYLASPIRAKAPEIVSGNTLSTDTTFWEVAKQWKQQRKVLGEYLETLPPDVFEKEVYKHPLTGRLKLSGMLSFFEKHFDRHHKQIYRTLKKVDAVKQV